MLDRLNRNQLKFDAHLNGMQETLKAIEKVELLFLLSNIPSIRIFILYIIISYSYFFRRVLT